MTYEEISSKSGPELFKEVLRLYSAAEVDDYYKKGVWRDDLMKTDWELMRLHRKEAGAPEPPPVEELDLDIPELPGPTPGATGGFTLKPLTPVVPGGTKTPVTVSPSLPKLGAVPTPAVRPVTPATAVAPSGASPAVVSPTIPVLRTASAAAPVGKVKVADQDVMNKTGVELFKEVLRWYPVADIEDYFKNGVWKDEIMRTDIELVRLHRKEAGSPDPIPLEAVVMPEMPTPAPVTLAKPAVAGGTVIPKLGVSLTGGASIPVAELRLIALFVAKFKLDLMRTKAALANMTAERRRHVMQNFQTTANGAAATTALEQYIAQCEKTNSWGGGTAAAAAPAVIPGGAGAAGVKRPLAALAAARPTLDASKRPRLGPVTVAPTVPSAKLGVVRAVRPLTPVTIRPGAGLRPPVTIPPNGGGSVRPLRPAVLRPVGTGLVLKKI